MKREKISDANLRLIASREFSEDVRHNLASDLLSARRALRSLHREIACADTGSDCEWQLHNVRVCQIIDRALGARSKK